MGVPSTRSIQFKAPLAVLGLIVLVVVALSASSFFALRNALRADAGERLHVLTVQLSESLENSVAAAHRRGSAMANRPAVVAYAAAPNAENARRALEALSPDRPPTDRDIASELRDRQGRVLLESTRSSDAIVLDDRLPLWDELVTEAIASEDGVVVGRFRRENDVIYYPVVAAVPGRTDVFAVNWRGIGDGAETRATIARLFGSSASVFYGNSDGTVWSELGLPAEPPAEPAASQSTFEFERQGRGRVMAVRLPIEGSPWSYTIEFPMAVIDAPAFAHLRTMIWVSLIFLVGGTLAAWIVGRRIVKPIVSLTAAAEEQAWGHRARVQVQRQDELGRLAAAFNAMADNVERSQAQLERTVRERTNELQAAQDSLARREKLALIGQLVGGVGHELRNPLGVMANAVFYLEAIQADAPAEVRQYLGILRRQIEHSTKVISDLLDLARAKPANRESIGVGTVIHDRVRQLNGIGPTLVADVPPDLPLVAADPLHIGQILDNLLSNAVQAINGSPGTVRIRARLIADGFVRVEVSDTGPGISHEHYSKLFEPLFTTRARGFGLGLALSKSLAQANGGDLVLASAPNEGATFAFTLPVAGGSA